MVGEYVCRYGRYYGELMGMRDSLERGVWLAGGDGMGWDGIVLNEIR